MTSFFRGDFPEDLGAPLRPVAVALDEFFHTQAQTYGDLSTEVTGKDHQHHVYIRIGNARPAKFCTFPRRTERESNFDMQISDLAAALGGLGFDESTYRRTITTKMQFLIHSKASTEWRFIKLQYEGLKSATKRDRFLNQVAALLTDLRGMASASTGAGGPAAASGGSDSSSAAAPPFVVHSSISAPADAGDDSSVESDIRHAEAELADLPPTERETVVNARRGQGPYRQSLLDRWQGCAVTGCAEPRLLRASHLKPWRLSTNHERLDCDNGLLLIATLDAALDSLLIAFDQAGHIRISPGLSSATLRGAGISPAMRLREVPSGVGRYLRIHEELFNAALLARAAEPGREG